VGEGKSRDWRANFTGVFSGVFLGVIDRDFFRGEEKREECDGAADWREGAGSLDVLEEVLGSADVEAEEEEGPAVSGGSEVGSILMVSDSSGSLGKTGKTSKGIPSLLTLILIS
jgi:hypothetical protein